MGRHHLRPHLHSHDVEAATVEAATVEAATVEAVRVESLALVAARCFLVAVALQGAFDQASDLQAAAYGC